MRLQEIWTETQMYREYLESMETFLQNEMQKCHEHMATFNRPSSVTGYDIKYETERFQEEIGYIEEALFLHTLEEFTNVLRKSFFVNLYAFLESRLLKGCRIKKSERVDIRLSLSDIRGQGIDKARVYLEKVLEIPFDFGPDWQEIQRYKSLRHCIVHNEGRLDEGFSDRNNALRTYVEDKDTLSLSSDGAIILSRDFCEEVLGVVQGFLESICLKLQEGE